MSLRNYLFLAGLIVCSLLGGWVGWSLHPAPVPLVVNRTVTKTVTRKPDGTIIHQESDAESSKPVVVPMPRWSAGGRVIAPVSRLQDYYWSFDLYRRVSDTGAWIGIGASTRKEVSLGIRLDF